MWCFLSNGSGKPPNEYTGKTIAKTWLDADLEAFCINFTDGVKISIWDAGQCCCERRYMRTDDDCSGLVGSELKGIEVRECLEEPDGDDYDVREIAFVEISTNKGFITLTNYNEHNGYYGGFWMTITERE